jgi:hypothetical protein
MKSKHIYSDSNALPLPGMVRDQDDNNPAASEDEEPLATTRESAQDDLTQTLNQYADQAKTEGNAYRKLLVELKKMANQKLRAAVLFLILLFPVCLTAQTQEQVQMANNPLAKANSFGFQNYYAPALFGVPGQSVNTFMIRPVVVTPRLIMRATVPLMTVPTLKAPMSGMGDINIFATYVWFFPKSYTDFGIGPIVVLPSATDSILGAGKYQLGVAAVLVQPLSKTVLLGSLITWQASVFSANAAAETRPSTSQLNFQPFYVFQIGGGFTLKGTAVWMFDFTNGHYAIPVGFGIGKVMVSGKAIISMGLEPQFTVLHYGTGQPEFQLFAGLTIQFPAKDKKSTHNETVK